MATQDGGRSSTRSIHYRKKDQLLELRSKRKPLPPCYAHINCLYPSSVSTRKRGKKVGLLQRLRRRGFCPPLPTIILANVRSISNKVDEICAHVRYDHIFRESCLLAFTETWLEEDDNDNLIAIDGFSCVRSDRTAESKKKKGGGLCVYINLKYCTNYTVKKRMCCPDLELLVLSMRPFYLPRDFGVIYIVQVYVPPTAKTEVAAAIIADVVHEFQTRSPDAPVVTLPTNLLSTHLMSDKREENSGLMLL
uniref:Uncharacterized protein n=1 Tax=Biomphalaria glabrata TaxID=6526 RepID=A0A2C9LT42_BIOGL